MADRGNDVSFTDTGPPRSRIGLTTRDGSTSDRATAMSHESVTELPVAYEGPPATGGRVIAAGPLADDRAAARTTALYGIHRDDGIWVTECAWCKRVRNVAGDWQTLTPSVRSEIRAERTHGICSECADQCLAQATGH